MSSSTGNKIDSISSTFDTPEDEYRRWHSEITLAEKELKPYWDKCRKIEQKYADRRDIYDQDMRKFNLFAANVDSVKAAVYAQPPKVEVSRRFNDQDDDVSRVAGLMLERCMEQDLDEPGSQFCDVVNSFIFDRLVAGMGQAWLRVEEEIEEAIDEFTGMVTQQVVEREVVVDSLHWSDFLYSPCRTYSERRWVARKVQMDRDSLIRRFGSEVGQAVPLDADNRSNRSSVDKENYNDALQKATIYEIWDRERRQVVWFSKAYPKLVDKRDDFLHLSTFEPCPPPLFGSLTTSRCVPIPDYVKCQDQYEEMNKINDRLAKLVDATVVRGLYDKTQPAIPRLLTEGRNNDLIPVDGWNAFKEKGGLASAIEWMPLEAITAAINVLRQEKEAKKQEIYELSGYSDILRGATKATETATAQKLKANFASGKIQKLQADVENFVRNIMFIKAEIVAKHFDASYFIQASNIQQVERDPALIQAAIQLIKNPLAREYKLSIKPESMAQTDYASEKSDRMELLGVVGEYMQKALPLAEAQPIFAELVVGMLKFGVAGFKAGKEFESLLDMQMAKIQQFQQQAIQQPPPPDPQQQKIAMEMQHSQQEHQLDMQSKQMELQFEAQKNSMELSHKARMAHLAATLGESNGRAEAGDSTYH